MTLEVRGTRGGHASRTWSVRALYSDSLFSADRPSRRVIQARTILRDSRFVRFGVPRDEPYLEHFRPHPTVAEEAADRSRSTLRPPISRPGESFVHWSLGRGSTFVCACASQLLRHALRTSRSIALWYPHASRFRVHTKSACATAEGCVLWRGCAATSLTNVHLR